MTTFVLLLFGIPYLFVMLVFLGMALNLSKKDWYDIPLCILWPVLLGWLLVEIGRENKP